MKQKLLTDFYDYEKKKLKIKKNIEVIIYGYNKKTGNWHCSMCGTNMGSDNPRQLCGKIFCDNVY